MKKIRLNKGLQLNKEVISKLQEEKLSNIKGGQAPGGSCCIFSCHMNATHCACGPQKTQDKEQ
ncbi:class I lanthipeptide [uncultured Psychroserpens sp.]|uniref:class I lanthipeptide n=1 Tax=uncultured Psychroserpens sp. TaxID=255436 RepID=UPI00260D10FC|nr:class I lanthipeptide [uncultured Psychroserpens sp.]